MWYKSRQYRYRWQACAHVSSSAGRRSAAYVQARNLFKTGQFLCWKCGKRPGTTVDHDPPLSTAPHHTQWRGRYMPACQPCQSKQGAAITNGRQRQAWPLQPTHPDRNVILIVGPPGAGKTTRAHEIGLTHFEREQYATDRDYKHAVQGFCARPAAQAVVVRTCITLDEQHEWEQLTGATHVEVIATPFNTCASRIYHRHNPRWRGEVAAAKRWHITRARGVTPMTRLPSPSRHPSPSRQW